MTVVLGYVLSDGVFMAADTLREIRDSEKDGTKVAEDRIKKISQIGSDYLVSGAGPGAMVQKTTEVLEGLLDKENRSADELCNLAEEAANRVYEELSSRYPNEVHFQYVIGSRISDGFLFSISKDGNFDGTKYTKSGVTFAASTHISTVDRIYREEIDRIETATGNHILDLWATRTIKRAEEETGSIALPAQVAMINGGVHEAVLESVGSHPDISFVADNQGNRI